MNLWSLPLVVSIGGNIVCYYNKLIACVVVPGVARIDPLQWYCGFLLEWAGGIVGLLAAVTSGSSLQSVRAAGVDRGVAVRA